MAKEFYPQISQRGWRLSPAPYRIEHMFETEDVTTTAELRGVLGALSRLDSRVDDVERVDQVRLLEQLKAAAAAAQAKVTTEFVASQRATQVDAGVLAREVGAGIAAQVALAKRESPARSRRYVGWAGILTTELPNTFTALREGRITEWRAQIVARETAWLSAEHRARVDAELAPRLESLGDRRVEAETRRLAYRLDPHGYLGRISKAERERRVSLRPAPDTMSVLRGLLPVAQGVSVLASLQQHADSLRSKGDERGRGQIMADTLVERVTGQAAADAVPVEVRLVMTDQALMNFGATPGEAAHSTATAQCLRIWLDGSPRPAPPRRGCGCGGSSPVPRPARSSRWSRGGATSMTAWPTSSLYETSSAGPRGAGLPSGTRTTSGPSRTAVRPPRPTARGCAKPATMPSRLPAGEPARLPARVRRSRSPPRPDTATGADRHPYLGEDRPGSRQQTKEPPEIS